MNTYDEDGKSWTEKSAREYEAIKEKVKLDKWIKKGGQIQGKNLTPMTDAYDIFVDVFAAKTGYLRWSTNFMMGRKLKDQHLLTIAEDEHLPPEDQNNDDDDDNDDGPEWACCCHFGSFCFTMTLVGGLMGLVGSKLVQQGIQIADEGHGEFSEKESAMIMGGSFGGWLFVSCLIYSLIWCCCTAFHFSKRKKIELAKQIQQANSDGNDEISQYFNPTDRDQSAFNVPFDDKVMPTLWCASRTSASPDVLENDPDSDVAAWAATRWADNREPNKKPKGTTLFPLVVAGPKGKNLARLKTKELRDHTGYPHPHFEHLRIRCAQFWLGDGLSILLLLLLLLLLLIIISMIMIMMMIIITMLTIVCITIMIVTIMLHRQTVQT